MVLPRLHRRALHPRRQYGTAIRVAHPVSEALEQGISKDEAQRSCAQGDAVGIEL